MGGGAGGLERALALASEVDERDAKVPMILDSLGELHMLRGDLDEAKSYLERAVVLATENGNKWYAGQALRTLGRCYLAMDDAVKALAQGTQALALAEIIGDRQAICESRLLLAEAHLRSDRLEESATELHKVTEKVTDSPADLGFAGEAQKDLQACWHWPTPTPPPPPNTSAAVFQSSIFSETAIVPPALTMNSAAPIP